MVSIISRWLQKRMPSYETLESKLTKEQIENNKDITGSLKMNIFLFMFLVFIIYISNKYNIFTDFIIYVLISSALINICSIIASILIASHLFILRYKIYMFMISVSLISDFISLFLMIIDVNRNFLEKLSLCILIITLFVIFFIKKVIINNKIVLNCMIGMASIVSILNIVIGCKDGIGNLIKEFIGIFFMLTLLKVIFDTLKTHYKTLLYSFTYPEEFRKKFGYSVKDWYGIHSPQYKAEKESQ